MPKEISKRIGLLNIVYTVAIVFYHFNLEGLLSGPVICNTLLDKMVRLLNHWISSSGVYAVSFFFMTSAFLLYYNMTKENIADKIRRRWRSLVIPYFLWNMIYMLLFSHARIVEKDWLSILKGFLNSEYCGPLWFVEGLIVAMLFCPVLFKIMRIPVLSECIVAISILGNLSGWAVIEHNALVDLIGLFRYLNYVPSYLLGVYLALRQKDFVWKDQYPTFLYVIAFPGFFLGLLETENVLWNTCMTVAHPIFLWIILSKITAINSSLQISKYTFMIYAMHDAGYQAFRRIFSYFHIAWFQRNDWSSVSIGYLFGYRMMMGCIVLFLCIVFSYICKRIAPKVYVLLSGGRT